MKLAIATEQGHVSAHFGRCPTYTLVDISEGKVTHREEIENPGHQPGFLPRYLSEKSVDTIIAGGMGPRAQGLFAQQGIQTIIGVQGPVDDVIEEYLNQKLEPGEDLCSHGGTGHEHPAGGESPSLTKNVCITARGPDLESEVDPRFGRAPYFLIVDPDTLEFEAVANTQQDTAHGAGIQAAQFVVEKKVRAVLTGQCGPNAQRVLEAAGIEIITDISCTVKEALEKLKRS